MSGPGYAGGGPGGSSGGGTGGKFELPGPSYLKMAVNNVVAGSIIGKNGSKINSIASSTNCTVRLSSANCYFPNTTDRVVVISGDLEKVKEVIYIILDQMAKISSAGSGGGQSPDLRSVTQNGNESSNAQAGTDSGASSGEGKSDTGADGNAPQQKLLCRIVVPKSSVSAIIGTAGQQIKALQETTSARIQISKREEGLDERIVNILGTLPAIKNAAITIASSIQADQNLRNHMYVEYSRNHFGQDGAGHHPAHGLSPTVYGQYNPVASQYGADVGHIKCEVFMQIPDNLVGSVIGRNGSNLTQIAEHAGAKITVSQKNDFYPGTSNRTLTIKGTVHQVHGAHILLIQRLNTVQSTNQYKPHNQVGLVSGMSQGPSHSGSGASGGAGAGGYTGQASGYGGNAHNVAAPPMRIAVAQGPPANSQAAGVNLPVSAAAYYQQAPQTAYHSYQLQAGSPTTPHW
eukprot:Selendium_serpulae@DN2001_c0_g1_i1.p1